MSFLMEFYGTLLNSIKQDDKTPFEGRVKSQLIPHEIINDEEYQFRMLQEEQTSDILLKCKRKRSFKAMANGLAHISYQLDNSYFEVLFKTIKKQVGKRDHDTFVPYLYQLEVLLSQKIDKRSKDPLMQRRAENFNMLMDFLLNAIKDQSGLYFLFMSLVDFLIKIATRYPSCRDWLHEQGDMLKKIRSHVE